MPLHKNLEETETPNETGSNYNLKKCNPCFPSSFVPETVSYYFIYIYIFLKSKYEFLWSHRLITTLKINNNWINRGNYSKMFSL